MFLGIDFRIKQNSFGKIKQGMQNIVFSQNIIEKISHINYDINILNQLRK